MRGRECARTHVHTHTLLLILLLADWFLSTDVCADDVAWSSSSGRSCEFYMQVYHTHGLACANGGYGPAWEYDPNLVGKTFADFANAAGVDAGTACCACGGGVDPAG